MFAVPSRVELLPSRCYDKTVMDEQTRIAQLLIAYEKMELDLETGRDQLSHVEQLYYDKILDFRRGQLKLLAEAERACDNSAQVKRTLAAQLGDAAEHYEQLVNNEEQNEIH